MIFRKVTSFLARSRPCDSSWRLSTNRYCHVEGSQDNGASVEGKKVTIGGVTKKLGTPKSPELVPVNYLPKDVSKLPTETLKHLKWLMQKDILGQDIFLIGRPSPLRRQLAMQYLELTNRELEYVALSRDTTESDLKQRREIVDGTAHYVDQSAVKAASEGRILVLEGIEKAERNVLPVLNNLLENREMHLEDGRLLIPANRYDKLLEEHTKEELDKWQLVRVSEDFRVIALGLPVPQYIGNPLDPPLRSRFQARDIQHLPFQQQLEVLQHLGPNVDPASISQILSFAHTLVTDESSGLGLPDFPVDNLPTIVKMMNNSPDIPPKDAIERLYPYKSFLPKEGIQSVEDTMMTFQILQAKQPHPLYDIVDISNVGEAKAQVTAMLDNVKQEFMVPSGSHEYASRKNDKITDYVSCGYHDSLISELMLSHSVKDICVIGPKGCGKSIVVDRLAELLGYETEHILLYQDMTARDLLQQRTTLQNGDTVWNNSPLVTAALEGKMAVLDGIHRIHRGTLAVLHRLVHDRELQLYDGTRLIGEKRYDDLKKDLNVDEEAMAERRIFKIRGNFRIVALAEPPIVGGSTGQWLTPEVLSMFLFHTMRPLSQNEELYVLKKLHGGLTDDTLGSTIKDVVKLTHVLRNSPDNTVNSIANSLSTRQLFRISKRTNHFPNETVQHAIQKACLTRFLPTLPREALEKQMDANGIVVKSHKELVKEQEEDIACRIDGDTLTIGSTSINLYNPSSKTKIPDTLFYDTPQNLVTMEAMLQDFLMGEHLLLVGNQGVGKNKLVDRLLNLMNRPREYIQLHRDTTVQSLTLQPTVREGIIVYEDSPLVKAVKGGNILVIDEADKAPTHVTCILKTLVESGEMILSDGRRIVRDRRNFYSAEDPKIIKMHPDFRIMVLANRPGFPFLGNDFFASLGDLFSCHAIDNPSVESEMSMLRQYGPDVPDETLSRLVRAFSELRAMADNDQIQYPYSTREVVNIVKHLQCFPDEGLGNVVRNVFDFDSYNKETKETLNGILQKHGIPIGLTSRDISLAREFDLPQPVRVNDWQVVRGVGRNKPKFMALPVKTNKVNVGSPELINVSKEVLDRTIARGLGFFEMQSYWSIPFHETATVGDVCVQRDKHGRQLYDKILVCSTGPAWMYSMRAVDETISRITLNHFFETRRTNVSPKIRMASLGGNLSPAVAVHDEVSNVLLLAEVDSGAVIRVPMSSFLESLAEMTSRLTKPTTHRSNFLRMLPNFSKDNELLFYTPNGNVIQMVQLMGRNGPENHSIELPFNVQSLHPLSKDKYLLVATHSGSEPFIPQDNIFMLRKESEEDPLPTLMNPISQTNVEEGLDIKIDSIIDISKSGLSDYGLSRVFGENVSSPNTLMSTKEHFAALAMGFPELEFSSNELYVWPRPDGGEVKGDFGGGNHYGMNSYLKFQNPAKGMVNLHKSCQIIRPVSYEDLPKECRKDLQGPGNVSAYLEVVDLMENKLRYIPIPEPAQMSSYASWYRRTYPDLKVACAETSNEGLVTVDNAGTLRLWETGVANLSRSLNEWRRMIGESDDRNLMIRRDGEIGDLDSPKHGKIDPTGAPHVGGNTWAGGSGGRDTAGLGGIGGPYRLDGGHDVHQVSDEVKAQVPEHIRKAARDMNRKAYAERLREIRMSEYDAELYEQYSSHVRRQVQSLKMIISGLQAKAKDRQWLKNQTSGELDDTKLIEGITGEKSIFKKRGEQDPEPGAPQEKPKRLRLLVDVSGSMYRFNGHDSRLERTMEATLMVMEALEGYSDRVQFEIYGHSGEESDLPFVRIGNEPKNEKDRLVVLRNMIAHSQFCMSGDHTLPATVLAINELSAASENYDESFVIVLSDANFDRYGISPSNFAKILTRNDKVNAFSIFIGSLGNQADKLTQKLPAGKSFVCLDTERIPEILKTIFTSSMLK